MDGPLSAGGVLLTVASVVDAAEVVTADPGEVSALFESLPHAASVANIAPLTTTQLHRRTMARR